MQMSFLFHYCHILIAFPNSAPKQHSQTALPNSSAQMPLLIQSKDPNYSSKLFLFGISVRESCILQATVQEPPQWKSHNVLLNFIRCRYNDFMTTEIKLFYIISTVKVAFSISPTTSIQPPSMNLLHKTWHEALVGLMQCAAPITGAAAVPARTGSIYADEAILCGSMEGPSEQANSPPRKQARHPTGNSQAMRHEL